MVFCVQLIVGEGGDVVALEEAQMQGQGQVWVGYVGGVVEGPERKGLNGIFRRPTKRFGKNASTKTVRKRRLLVGEVVEKAIFRARGLGRRH